MTASVYPNKTALSSALDIYLDAMRPFVVRCMQRIPGKRAADAIAETLNDRRRDEFHRSVRGGESVPGSIEFGDFPHLVNRRWRETFAGEFNNDHTVLNQLWVAAEARNRASHRGEGDIEAEYVRTRLYDVAEMLDRIKAPEAAAQVRSIRDALPADATALPVDQPATPTEASGNGPEARSANGLRPWREVAPPNTDVTDDTFREAEFAADLQQVHDGRADATEYGNPVNFFKRTHVTPGMRTLMENVLKRIAGTGGDPVIQTKTGFGGGKTHSLIALYHLARTTRAVTENEDARRLVEDAGLDPDEASVAKVAVLDGTHLSPTTGATTATGDPLNTLWGEMAHQLGGQDGYEIVGAAARGGSAPGGRELNELLQHAGACVILIDELVLYARNAGVDWDSVYTFVQNLTQAVRRSDRAVLVVALPEQAAEAGGERGAAVLTALDRIFGRIEATWEPLEISEAFEVVRRRLFGDEIDEVERNRTCEAFSRMYGRSRSDWPEEAGEQRYLERMKKCYPIHPEIFDRLYEDWSSIPRFQRTRGVLRMMANCISRLYRDNDRAPLIMPGDLPFRDSSLSNEFATLLDGQWDPVFSEADGANSRADRIDAANRRYSDVGGAARRIARAVLLGSAPGGAVRGIDARGIRLGVVQPGHGVSAYNEALARMSGELHYLYDGGGRYWFHAEENLNKVAADREGELADREISEHIAEELRNAIGRRTDAVICPQHSADVPDDGTLRLVVLPPDKHIPSRSSETDEARAEALATLLHRGNAPRVHRNTLLFLAARNDEIRALRSSVRTYLAWASIVNGERRIENLTGERATQARASLTRARNDTDTALARAWRHALAPSQANPQQAEYGLTAFESGAAESGEIVRAAFEELVSEEALVEKMSPSALANMLKQYVWSYESGQYHVSLSALWDMMTANVYMPRLRSRDVLAECVRQGTADGAFGYAGGYDGTNYAGLRWREPIAGMFADSILGGILVEPEMAELAKGEPPAAPDGPRDEETPAKNNGPGEQRVSEGEPQPGDVRRGSSRIVASKAMGGDISLDEVNKLRDEIIRTLREDGGEIVVRITIEAGKAGGFSEQVARVVRENGRELGLDIDVSG